MKTGILTFHRAQNYGAVLQCYALQEVLRRRGHEVSIIDYRQHWIEEFYKVISPYMIRRNSGSAKELTAFLKNRAKKFLFAPGKARNFADFRKRFLSLSEPCFGRNDIPEDYDCYVIGSDQLWSLHCLGGSVDRTYLGDFVHRDGSRIVGYAISADSLSIEAIKDELPCAVQRFSALSMREGAIAARVTGITGKECHTCLDPTLLTDASLWDEVTDDRWKDENYVLVYEVRRKDEDKGLLRRKARRLAEKIGGGCRVIDLSSMRYSVRDFVSLFRYARHVVTTSFHGTAFSIIFGTPFHVLPLWNGYDLRYMELLKALGAEDRIAQAETDIEPSQMDFSRIHERLAAMQEASFSFIDKALRP